MAPFCYFPWHEKYHLLCDLLKVTLNSVIYTPNKIILSSGMDLLTFLKRTTNQSVFPTPFGIYWPLSLGLGSVKGSVEHMALALSPWPALNGLLLSHLTTREFSSEDELK